MSKSKRVSRGANSTDKTFDDPPIRRFTLNTARVVSGLILLAGLWIIFKPTYPPASAGEPITEIHLSVENLFGEKEENKPIIDESVAIAFQKKEEARIAEEKRIAAQRRILTVTSGSSYGTAKLLYRDTLYWNCVSFVKAKTGIYRTLGNGARAAIQGQEPRIGAIGAVVGRVHAVYITAVNGDQVTFIESNYVRGWITERTLPTKYFIGYVYN